VWRPEKAKSLFSFPIFSFLLGFGAEMNWHHSFTGKENVGKENMRGER
jgi:hypothetical protein